MPHRYVNIDEDLGGLERAKSLNHGTRRTPTIDLGLGGPALVEPDNDTLTAALVEVDMLTRDDARERMTVQNVGDLERVARSAGALLLLGMAAASRPGRKWPFAIAGAVLAFSGVSGWCPVYYLAGVTSLDGPGDRPDEAGRTRWLTGYSSVPQPPKSLMERAR